MAKQLYSNAREVVRTLLRQARTEAGLSQVELAARLGRPQSYVSDYERSHRRLDWVGVAEALDACGYDLLRFTQDYLVATKKKLTPKS